MTILLCDPRVAAVPVAESGEPLVRLDEAFGPARALVRRGLADRLATARLDLPRGIALRVVEGHRSVADQSAIIAAYSAEVCAAHPGISPDDLHRLTSRFVSPLAVAPHVAGAAVDLTLVDACGDELDLGTPIDATPEQSAGACYFAADGIGADARAHRDLLARVMGGAGLVNYPTEWWHWSHGDRYWALLSGAEEARYGPIEVGAATEGRRVSALAALPDTRSGHGPRLDVDLAAVAANLRVFTARTTAAVMAVVKADGFGHGAVDVARTALAHGARSLGVTSIEEALALRAADVRAPVLSWLNPLDAAYAAALAADVDLAVPSREHLDAITHASRQSAPTRGPARVHLHLDTGMARDGAEPAAWPALCRAARRAERAGLVRVVAVMGHLGCADDPSDECNSLGRRRFAWGIETARAAGLRPAHRHLAATAATLTDTRSHHTTVRIGAGLVGIDPSRTTVLRPALTLTAPVVSVRRVRAGSGVGYSHTWTAPAATSLALLPLGYADGLPRAASGRAEVMLRGRRHPVVGRISMDQVVVDLGDAPVRPRDTATVFGPGDAGEPTVADWAAWADTLEHEIVTGLGSRLHRHVMPAGPTHLRSLA